MMLFRSAVKQICRRQGYHASFMCRPKLPNVMSSGWHLHQSLRDKRTGANAFMPDGDAPLSPLGRHYLAGLLAHARGAAAFTTPTINGYKRYRQYTLAPDRVIWGRDNRGVMLRVIGGAGRWRDADREPGRGAVRQSLSLHGVADRLRARRHRAQARAGAVGRHALRDGRAAPAEDASKRRSWRCARMTACAAGFGKGFVDYFIRIKQGELARYQTEVTEWEQREYFELF